jgi:hypothetical protein
MDTIEQAARKLAIDYVERTGRPFDFRAGGALLMGIMRISAGRWLDRENPFAIWDTGARVTALYEARDAITFEALDASWGDSRYRGPKGTVYAPQDAIVTGHCVHRAKSILSEMIREAEK